MIHTFLTRCFAFLASGFIRCVYRFNHLSMTRPEVIEQYISKGCMILACWHSRLFFLTYYYAMHIRRPQGTILISMSRDGDYGMALVKLFQQDAIRGSSSRGGQRAIRLLVERLKQGNNVALTPDGPRGPAFHVHEGIIKLAQLTGSPIIPVSYDASRKKTLKSWDQFIVPKPFGRIHMAFGEPLYVPRESGPSDIATYQRTLESCLLDLDKICSEQVNSSKATR